MLTVSEVPKQTMPKQLLIIIMKNFYQITNISNKLQYSEKNDLEDVRKLSFNKSRDRSSVINALLRHN